MACTYAGPMAEARCLHRSFFTVCLSAASKGDLQFIARVAKLWWTAQADRDSKDDAAERLARKLIRSQKGWEVICKIAAQLFGKGRLSYEECWDLYVSVTGREPLTHCSPSWRIEPL